MAHMIPATPKEFDERSHEGDIFNALKKLPEILSILNNF